MKNTRRLLAALLALTMIFSLLSAAGAAELQGEIDLFHRFPNEPESTSFERIVEAYMEKNPGVTVNIEYAANDPYKEKIKIVLGSGQNVPDVMFTWCGEFTNRFVRENKVLNLSENMTAEDFDAYLPGQLAPFSYQDSIWALPFLVNGKVWYYNKTMLADAGITAPPATHEEFLAQLQQVQDASGKRAIAYGNLAAWASTHYTGTLFQKIVDPAVTAVDYAGVDATWTDPGYVDALNIYVDMLQYANEGVNGIDHEGARNNWLLGEHAFMFMETMEIDNVDRDMLDGFEYDMFPWPAIEGGKGDQNMITGAPEGFMVSASTDQKEISVDFLKYMTGIDAGVIQRDTVRWLNAAKGVITPDDPDQMLYASYLAVENASGMANWLDTEVHSIVAEAILTGGQELTGGSITPEQLMAQIQEAAERAKPEIAAGE